MKSWFVLALVTFVGDAQVPPVGYHSDPQWVTKQDCLDHLQDTAGDFLEWFKKENHPEARVEFSCEHLELGRPA